MKALLITSLVLLFSACVAPTKLAPTRPAPKGDDPNCPVWGCGANGTQVTGLTHGDRAGTIETIALPSGEVVTLR